MIELKNISKTFYVDSREIEVLKNIDITVEDGEIFGIIGLSGAGKSTLVRCINFLERPTDGEVVIDGKVLSKLSKKELLKLRQNIGMVFQSYNLFAQRTVLKNICYPLEIAGVKKDEAKKRAMELLELVGLTEKAKYYPSQLSGGQKQRVAIARALATETKYLLCDEATSALDPETTQSILDLMVKINKTLGVTIVVITHEMKIVEKICDRVAVIDKGVIVELGKTVDVFTNPKSAMARSLIMPEIKTEEFLSSNNKLRIIFNGENSYEPVLANLILECQTPVNIIHAETKDIDDKAYGQVVILLPNDDFSVKKITSYLKEKNVNFEML